MTAIERKTAEIPVTWATAADSNELAVGGYENFRVYVPVGFVGATITILGFVNLTETYVILGSTLAVSADKLFDLVLTSGLKKIKLRSSEGTEAKTGALLMGT